MKKIGNIFKGKIFSKENAILMSVAFILCCGIVVSKLNSEIPLHDGDVLVDSKNISDEEKNEEKSMSFEQQKAKLELERNELIGKCDDVTKRNLNQYMEQEVACENVIKTKNLPDCLVIVTENKVTVTVDEENLKQDTVAKICNVIMEETGRSADKIVIQSKY